MRNLKNIVVAIKNNTMRLKGRRKWISKILSNDLEILNNRNQLKRNRIMRLRRKLKSIIMRKSRKSKTCLWRNWHKKEKLIYSLSRRVLRWSKNLRKRSLELKKRTKYPFRKCFKDLRKVCSMFRKIMKIVKNLLLLCNTAMMKCLNTVRQSMMVKCLILM